MLGALAFLGVVACGPAVGEGDGPVPRLQADLSRPLEVYRRIGLLTGPDDFPAVAAFATLAGRGDSTLVLFGLSLPTDALQFHREGDGFSAGYLVSLRFVQDSQRVRVVDRRETVRVTAFDETARTDEAVVFQAAVHLEPGVYGIGLRVRDALSAQGMELEDTLIVPDFAAGGRTIADPVPVLRGAPRPGRATLPDLILNPRQSVTYGDPASRVYVERYDGDRLALELRSGDSLVWSDDVVLEAGAGTAGAVVELPVDSLPPGPLTLTARTGTDSAATSLLVTLSESWLADNLEAVSSLLRYIASEDELEALREGSAEERLALWEDFWARRDPVPATPANEFREAFFERVRTAAQQFGENGRPGWLTDRGEVYIVLGPPSRYTALRLGPETMATGISDAQQWVYDRVPGGGRLTLVFIDRNGFGSYRLTPDSESAFRSVARRIRLNESRR